MTGARKSLSPSVKHTSRNPSHALHNYEFITLFSYTFVITGSFTQTNELNYLHLLLLQTHYVRILFETFINFKTIILTMQ